MQCKNCLAVTDNWQNSSGLYCLLLQESQVSYFAQNLTGCDSKFARSAPVYCICPHIVIHMTLIKSSNVIYSWYLCANILEKRCTWYLDKYSIFSNTCSNSFHETSLIYTKFYPKQHCIGHMSQKMLYGIEEFSLIFTWTRIWQMMFSVFCRIYLYMFLSNKSLIHSHNLSHEYRLQIISLQFSEYYKPHYLVQVIMEDICSLKIC